MTDTMCSGCTVRDVSLCGALRDDELSALNTIGRRHKLDRGESMMWAGQPNLYCGNLLSGVLKLSASMADGREQIVALLYPSDFIGQPFAEAIDFSVSALTDTEVCLFPRDGFKRVLGQHPRMERLLLERTLANLSDARTRILLMGRAGAHQKVSAFLLDVAARAQTRCPGTREAAQEFELPVSRREIADVLGLTIETVSRQFAKLKKAGTIEVKGSRGVRLREPDRLLANLSH